MSGPEILGEGKWLRLVRDGRWEFVQRTVGATAVVLIAVTEADELILVEQLRPPVGGAVIELPAGLIGDLAEHRGETPERAAARELEEETGFVAASFERLAAGPVSPGLSDEQVVLFRARGLRRIGPGGGDESENIRVHLVPLADLATWLAARERAGLLIDIKVWSAMAWTRG